MSGRICKLCKKECVTGEERIHCMGPCCSDFHSKCVGFTPVSLKFYKSCDSLFFECEECRDNPYRMINIALDKILSFMCILNERMNRQETNCDSIFKHFETLNSNLQKYENERSAENEVKEKVNHHAKASSAETYNVTVPDAVALVRPKNQQKCADTRADLDKHNIPDKIAMSVNNLPNGGIEIKCRNKQDLPKLHENATNKLGEGYNVVIPKQHKPKIRVTNMSVKHSEENIIACMRNQNELLRDADMKVLRVFDIKYNESYGAIIEVEPKAFNIILSEKVIVIGMNTCDVTECISVLRCYKCCGYNHKSNVCRNKKACLRCGGEHEIRECKAKRSECVNCKRVLEKHSLDLDLNHPAWSKICPTLKRNLAKEKLRIAYATTEMDRNYPSET